MKTRRADKIEIESESRVDIRLPSSPVTGRSGRRSKLTAVVVLAAFALAACAAPGQPARPATSGEGASAAEAALSATEIELPMDFQIAVYQGGDLLGGEQVSFESLVAQGKPVVLNFWAGLCPPCRVEMPDLQEVHETYSDQILLVGVDVGVFTGLGNEEDGRALLQEVGVTYPAGSTGSAEVMRAYEVIGMPTTVFITPSGEINQKWTGLLTKEKMEELVQELLAASGSS